MASRLEMLPPELLLLTFGYMPRPSDLLALCLTSKIIRHWAIMLLYRTVIIDSNDGECLQRAEKSLLRIGNPHLAYVRKLVITPKKNHKDSSNEARLLRLFLSMLPRNGLRHIECSSIHLDETTMFLLLAQQQKLSSIYLGLVKPDFSSLLETSALSWADLTALQVPRNLGYHDLEAYQNIIKQAPQLSELSIGCSKALKSLAEDARLMWTSCDDIQYQLLGQFSPYDEDDWTPDDEDDWIKPRIVKLSLSIHIHPNLLSRFDVTFLRSLCLWQCEDCEPLLQALTDASKKGVCALREFTYNSLDDQPFEHELVEDLLRSFAGLEKLSLNCNKRNPAARSIFDYTALDNHKATLRSVFIECGHIDEREAGEELLGFDPLLVSNCPKLRYLAIPMPASVIPLTASSSSLEYMTTFKSLMSSLPDLKVLHLLNLPRVIPASFAPLVGVRSSEWDSRNVKIFLLELNEFVSKTLGPHLQSVTVVCFGRSEHEWNGTNDGSTEVVLRILRAM